MYDISFKYFLGTPSDETDLTNPSPVCKLCELRSKDKDLLDLFIGKTVSLSKEFG